MSCLDATFTLTPQSPLLALILSERLSTPKGKLLFDHRYYFTDSRLFT
jgi:hypothetical protein